MIMETRATIPAPPSPVTILPTMIFQAVSDKVSVAWTTVCPYHGQLNAISQAVTRKNPSTSRDVVEPRRNQSISDHQEGLVNSGDENAHKLPMAALVLTTLLGCKRVMFGKHPNE